MTTSPVSHLVHPSGDSCHLLATSQSSPTQLHHVSWPRGHWGLLPAVLWVLLSLHMRLCTHQGSTHMTDVSDDHRCPFAPAVMCKVNRMKKGDVILSLPKDPPLLLRLTWLICTLREKTHFFSFPSIDPLYPDTPRASPPPPPFRSDRVVGGSL